MIMMYCFTVGGEAREGEQQAQDTPTGEQCVQVSLHVTESGCTALCQR